MIGSTPFFKREEFVRNKPAVINPNEVRANYGRMRDMGGSFDRNGMTNNNATRPFVGHPRFGFHTMLNTDTAVKLPTAPPIVGGNTDWTKSKVTPATQYLHSVLAGGRPMNPAPALGSVLRLTEPTVNSIHTTY